MVCPVPFAVPAVPAPTTRCSERLDRDDTGIEDAGGGVYLLDQIGAVGPEEVEGAPVSGNHCAADVANSLALTLELDARGDDVPLVETKLLRRDVAQVALDDEEGQAHTPP